MKNHIKKLDILRVIALFGVFFYHFIEAYVPSGYLGVCSFFVLAGFLSIYTIIDDDESKSTLEAIEKIWYKIKKLFPSLAITIILVSIIMILFYNSFLKAYPSDAASSLFFYNNIMQILRKESYFEAGYNLKPFTHIWALAIEMQFYILFYLFVYTFYNKKRINLFKNLFIILSLISIIFSFGYLILCGGGISVVYYSLSMRIYSFLMGMITCILCKTNKKIAEFKNKNILYLILILLIVPIFVRYEGIYINIMLILYSILSSIACIYLYNIDKQNKKNNYKIDVIGIISKRSYIIYLIHYPIIVFANRIVAHTNINIYLFIIVVLLLIIILSEIFYKLNNFIIKFNKFEYIIILFILIFANILLINRAKAEALITNFETNIENDSSEIINDDIIINNDGVNNNEDNTNNIKEVETTASEKETEKPKKEIKYGLDEYDLTMDLNDIHDMNLHINLNCVDRINQYIGETAYISKEDYVRNYGRRVTIIGDSMAVCAKNAIHNYFPNSRVEAFGNRQFEDVPPILAQLINENDIGDVVILALGTNAAMGIKDDVLELIYSLLPNKYIVFTTVVLPNVVNERNRNEDLLRFVINHRNCYLANWHGAAKDKLEIFQEDDIHPDGIGCYIYAQVLYKAMTEPYKEVRPGQLYK